MINKKGKIFSEFEFQFFFSFEIALLNFFYFNKMKRPLLAWSFHQPSVKSLRDRCSSGTAEADQDSRDWWASGEVRVVFCFLLFFFNPM